MNHVEPESPEPGALVGWVFFFPLTQPGNFSRAQTLYGDPGHGFSNPKI